MFKLNPTLGEFETLAKKLGVQVDTHLSFILYLRLHMFGLLEEVYAKMLHDYYALIFKPAGIV